MTIIRECPKHGSTEYRYYGKNNNKHIRCLKCSVERVSEKRRKNKLDLVNYFGGACKVCGYNKCIAALEFHHLNPKQKDFGLSVTGNTKSYKRLLEEASKCILVCCRCHREIHANLISIPE